MSFERELFDELNELRADPQKYANKVKKYLSYFDGKVLNIPGRKNGLATIEGPRGYEDTVNYLSRQKPLDAFTPSKALFRLSKDFLAKIQRKNVEDADDIDIEKLMAKYGTFYGDFGQAIDYGSETPEQVVINLLVSDGDPTKEQRTSLFNSSYKLIGMCKGSHKSFPHCTVILKCTEFENHMDADDNGFINEEDNKPTKKPAAAKPQPAIQPKVQAQPQSRIVKQPEPKREAPAYGNRYQRQPAPKQESRPYTRQEPKQESRPYTRQEPKQESRPYTRQEPKQESKPYVGRYQRAATKPESKANVNQYQRTETKPEPRRYTGYQRQQPVTSQASKPYTRQEPVKDSKPYVGRYQRAATTKAPPSTKSSSTRVQDSKPYVRNYQRPAQNRQEVKPYNRKYQTQANQNAWSNQNKQSFHQKNYSQPETDSPFGSSSKKDPNVLKEKRNEKITIEGGVKKKVVTIERTMKDGSVESEIFITDA